MLLMEQLAITIAEVRRRKLIFCSHIDCDLIIVHKKNCKTIFPMGVPVPKYPWSRRLWRRAVDVEACAVITRPPSPHRALLSFLAPSGALSFIPKRSLYNMRKQKRSSFSWWCRQANENKL